MTCTTRCAALLLFLCVSFASASWPERSFSSQKAPSHDLGRALKVIAVSDTQSSKHESQGYTLKTDAAVAGPFATRDLPPFSMMTAKMVTGLTPEQLSVTYWAPGAYLISWATGDAQVGIGLTPPKADAVQSVVEFGYAMPSGNETLPNEATGAGYTYEYVFSSLPGFNFPDYTSPVTHHTFITGVEAGKTVFYRVGDPRYGWSDIRNFTSTPDAFPFAITVIADSGQTPNTSAVVQGALARNANLLLNVGDLVYADTFSAYGQEVCWLRKLFNVNSKAYHLDPIPGPCPAEPKVIIEAPTVYSPKWDTWARLFEPLFSHIPIMQVAGNHEIELQPDNRTFTAYNTRYPQPQNPGSFQINTSAVPANVNGSDNNLYSAAVVPGIATVIMLSSFQPNVTFGGADDRQLGWLKQQLAAVDRSKTPWLIVNFHVPSYSTDAGTYKILDCMRLAYEPLLLEAQVDVVFNGHVHAYERTYPVANFSRNDCGIVHIVVGCAGNDEGLSNVEGWIDEVASNSSGAAAYCTKGPQTRKWPNYQPQKCLTFQEDLPGPYHYCPFEMPSWAAYRDTSFGSGTLTLHNSTTATWEFYRTQDGANTVADRMTLTRTPDKCKDAFKAAGSPASSPQPPSSPASPSSGSSSTPSSPSSASPSVSSPPGPDNSDPTNLPAPASSPAAPASSPSLASAPAPQSDSTASSGTAGGSAAIGK